MRCVWRENLKVILLRWWYSWKLRKYAKGFAILIDWLGDGGVPCSKEQAEVRANICRRCPNNVPNFTVASKMAAALKYIREQMGVKQELGLRVTREHELGTCKVCLCHIPLKIFLPSEEILAYTSDQERKEFPPECWIVKEHKAHNEHKPHS